jgi:hypothetical protein
MIEKLWAPGWQLGTRILACNQTIGVTLAFSIVPISSYLQAIKWVHSFSSGKVGTPNSAFWPTIVTAFDTHYCSKSWTVGTYW